MHEFYWSELESRRFDLNIHRGQSADIDDKNLLKYLIEHQVDILIARFPSEVQYKVSQLDRIGIPYLTADTLVYYEVMLKKVEPQPLRNSDLEFRVCSAGEIKLLNQMVEQIFQNYTNHYFSNPFLDKVKITEGYQEWTRNYISELHEDRIVWLVYRENDPIGFATCSYHDTECEGVLYGVKESAAGKGIYSDIIRFTQGYFKERGFQKMKVSTQAQNYSVQKVWGREGFNMSQSYFTVHVNSFLQVGFDEEHMVETTIREKDIEQIAASSGDRNRIHFSDAEAQKSGFKGRIAHGLISNHVISKYLGNVHPGHGTIFMGYRYKYLSPMYADETYRYYFSFPVNNRRGYYHCVIKVLNKSDQICLLVYADLYNKMNIS